MKVDGTPLPMARRGDPSTSHRAAHTHADKLSLRREQVYELVRLSPGKTSGEYSRDMLRRYDLPLRTCAETPHKRLPELEKLGYVRRGQQRICRDSGQMALTWWLARAWDR